MRVSSSTTSDSGSTVEHDEIASDGYDDGGVPLLRCPSCFQMPEFDPTIEQFRCLDCKIVVL